LFERPRAGERAVLVNVVLESDREQDNPREFTELASSAGAQPIRTVTVKRVRPDPRYYIGSGKAEEIRDLVASEDGELILFNHALSPGQEKNLEHLCQCRVLDRTGLILDIFAQRARSFEGKLQVELAQLAHLSTRLIRGWTHLERQKGGIGLRGPGETQLETDRRLIGIRIKQLRVKLRRVDRQRQQGRRGRHRASVPTVSLVGYTNAGKSTLFNTLTGAGAYAADQLFATLDPTLRRLQLPGTGNIVLADTVGFIRQLPHDLVAAFRSTLEETREADLLLHVVDAGDPARRERIAQVNQVLQEIGAGDVPQLLVYNKCDLLDGRPRIDRDEDDRPWRVWVSGLNGSGTDQLLAALSERIGNTTVEGWLCLPVDRARLRGELFDRQSVKREYTDAQGRWWLYVQVAQQELERLCVVNGVECKLYPDSDREFLASAAQGQ